MFFEKNKEALKKNNYCLFEEMDLADFQWDENKSTVKEAKNGESMLIFHADSGKDIYLSSRYNPTHEAEKYMEDSIDLVEKATLVVIGFGNGTHIREFINKSKKDHTDCVVYEPSKDIFMRIMHDIDITDILEDGRIHILVEGMNNKYINMYLDLYIDAVNASTNKHIALPKYRKVFEQECKDFLHLLRSKYSDLQVEANTIRVFGKTICYNSIHNMCFLPGCRSGVDYTDRFPKDMPGIVVAAGPSLAKNVELLKQAKGKALIIVVDTAIRAVMSRGIVPDFVISIDNHKPVSLFEVEGIEKVPFLGEIAMNTEVLERINTENLIFYSADSPIWGDMFRETGSDIRHLYAGGSVAIDAMANLIEWGFKRIIMIGQDLMMTGNRHHVGEDTIKDVKDLPHNIIEVEDIDGNMGYTTSDYYMYIHEIEKLAERFDVEFIDATEGGAKKKHTKIMTLQAAIDEYCKESYDVDAIIKSAPVLFADDKQDIPYKKLLQMKENLQAMKVVLDNGVMACDEGIELLEKKQYDIPRLKQINEILANVDAKYETFDESVSVLKYSADAYYIFTDSFYMEEDDEIKEAIRMYTKAKGYYNKMAVAIPDVAAMVDEAIERWHRMYG